MLYFSFSGMLTYCASLQVNSIATKSCNKNSPSPGTALLKGLLSNTRNKKCTHVSHAECEFYNIQSWFYA
jgi:hypothetical protein